MPKKVKTFTGGQTQIFTTEAMIEAVIECEGYVQHAAVKIGCKPQTIHVRALYEKDLKKAIEDGRNIRKQMLQDEDLEILTGAYKSAKNLTDLNNPTMTIFTLKAIGGWKEGGNDKETEMNPAQRAAMAKEKADD